MNYDASKLLTDTTSINNAEKLYKDVLSISNKDITTTNKIYEIKILNPDKTTSLDTISMLMGWLTFPNENESVVTKTKYREITELLCFYLSGVTKVGINTNDELVATSTEQRQSPYLNIFKLIDSANELIKYYKTGLIFDNDKINLFTTLIHIERAIDTYRGLLPPGSATQFPDDKFKTDEQLNELRSSIWNIGNSLDKKASIDSLNYTGEDFKTRFIK